MLLKCERCGAPLEVPVGSSLRCPYCGTTATGPAPVAPSRSPQQPHYQQQLQLQTAVRGRSSCATRLVARIFTGALVLGVGSVVWKQVSQTASKILLWAARPADRRQGLLVGLDEATGAQLYELPVPDMVSNSPQVFQFNGRYVLAVNWGALRAYDPATGKEVWRVGR